MFRVELSSSAERFIKKADKLLVSRIIDRIEKLTQDPFPTDVKRVVNRKEKVFRIRVGDYRIQYVVIYETQLIFISDIDHRSKAY